MYNSKLIWYNKEDVLQIFPITERTYFRKLKGLSPKIKTKCFKNKKGKNTTLVHYQDVGKVFERKRIPKNLDNPEVLRNYVVTKHWDFIGNLVPSKTNKKEVIEKMRFFQSLVKSKDNDIVLFFNLEKNKKDNFYHCHFLIKSKLPKQEIYEFLHLVCDDKIDYQRNIDLNTYDFETYQFRGSMYSDKFGKYNYKNHQEYIHSELMR
jgi:hypothetical protein